MPRAWFLPLVALTLSPYAALAQGNPTGPEFRINTFTTGFQAFQSVAVQPGGEFVVVWHSAGQDGSGYGVFAQRYDPLGAPAGPEFRVNTFTPGAQSYANVAATRAGTGAFVVVWSSTGQDGSAAGVFAQRYDVGGTPLGPEFRVNTYTAYNQDYPAAAADGAGNFVVVWRSASQDGSGYGVFGQRYSSSGAPLGPEFRVNTYTTGNQYFHTRVAVDQDGDFVVVWTSDAGQDGSGPSVMGQRYASTGVPQGPEFLVNTYTTGNQRYPSVITDDPGNFVVLWNSFGQNGDLPGVFGQRYASSGAPLGGEFRVNTHTTGLQVVFSAAADAGGNFVVVWHDGSGADGSSYGVFGQRFDSSAAPLGPEFLANTFTPAAQSVPSVGANALGQFVVAWSSYGQDGSDYGVFGQRYTPILPVELMWFGVE